MRGFPRSAAAGLVPALVLLAYAACAILLWTRPGWKPNWDSAHYILTAQSLARGEGYRYLGEPFLLRPPGFAAMVAAVGGAGPFDAAPVNRLGMVWAALAVAAVYFWARSRFDPARALLLALLTGTSPIFVERFNWVLSDLPFMALFYLGMGCHGRAAGRRPRLWAALACLLLALAFYLRTVAVLLIPALAAAALVASGRRRRTSLGIAVGLTILVLPWFAWTRAVAPETPPDQFWVASYAAAVLRVDPSDPDSARVGVSELRGRTLRNGDVALRSLGGGVLGARTPFVGAIVAGLALAGLVFQIRQRQRPGPRADRSTDGDSAGGRGWLEATDVFALLYVALLLGYLPHDTRLYVPLLPLVYGYVLGAADAAAGWLAGDADRDPDRTRRPGWAGASGLAVAVLLLLLNLIQLPVALSQWPRFEALETAADWIRTHTREDDVVMAGAGPIYEVLTGRRSVTHRYRPGPELLERYAPDVVIFEPRTASAGRLEPLVAARAVARHVIPIAGEPRALRIYEMPPAQSEGAGGSGSR